MFGFWSRAVAIQIAKSNSRGCNSKFCRRFILILKKSPKNKMFTSQLVFTICLQVNIVVTDPNGDVGYLMNSNRTFSLNAGHWPWKVLQVECWKRSLKTCSRQGFPTVRFWESAQLNARNWPQKKTVTFLSGLWFQSPRSESTKSNFLLVKLPAVVEDSLL